MRRDFSAQLHNSRETDDSTLYLSPPLLKMCRRLTTVATREKLQKATVWHWHFPQDKATEKKSTTITLPTHPAAAGGDEPYTCCSTRTYLTTVASESVDVHSFNEHCYRLRGRRNCRRGWASGIGESSNSLAVDFLSGRARSRFGLGVFGPFSKRLPRPMAPFIFLSASVHHIYLVLLCHRAFFEVLFCCSSCLD